MEQIKPNKRYLLATNEDLKINLSLKTNFDYLDEFNNSKIISLSDLFTKERNESTKYRIYGNINYLSFLRNKSGNLTELAGLPPSPPIEITGVEDLFTESITNTFFSLENLFDIKLFKLQDEQTTINNSGYTYIEKLTALTTSNDYNLSYFSYSKNSFNERNYFFNFNTVNADPNKLIKIDDSVVYDNNLYLGFIPKINLDLYEKRIVDNGIYINEIDVENSDFNYSAITFTDAQINLIIQDSKFTNEDFKKYLLTKLDNLFRVYNLKINDKNINNNLRFIRNYLDIGNGDYRLYGSKLNNVLQINSLQYADWSGDTVLGNYMSFDKETYKFETVMEKEFIIKIIMLDYPNIFGEQQFNDYVNQNYSAYTYNSFFQNFNSYITIDFFFKFKPFHKIELKKYSDFFNEFNINAPNVEIPNNAIIYNNKYIWRDLLTYGDPDNYDRPFINNNHYVYNDIVFYLKPELSDKNTVVLMNEFLMNFKDEGFRFNKDEIKLNNKGRRDIC